MQWIVYVISALLIILAIYILVKEIKKMVKGKCCENCKSCASKNQCSASPKTDKENDE